MQARVRAEWPINTVGCGGVQFNKAQWVQVRPGREAEATNATYSRMLEVRDDPVVELFVAHGEDVDDPAGSSTEAGASATGEPGQLGSETEIQLPGEIPPTPTPAQIIERGKKGGSSDPTTRGKGKR